MEGVLLLLVQQEKCQEQVMVAQEQQIILQVVQLQELEVVVEANKEIQEVLVQVELVAVELEEKIIIMEPLELQTLEVVVEETLFKVEQDQHKLLVEQVVQVS